MTIENLADTIKPKSDQLNADDLLTGPQNITVTGVRRGSADQPVILDIDGGRMPYKPCKTMRRLLILCWGDNGHEWVGRSMTVYNDPNVKWGGVAVGGIRISHLSHITQPSTHMLTATRGKKAGHTVHPLVVEDHSAVISEFVGMNQDRRDAAWPNYTSAQQAAINSHFNQQNQ